MIFYEAIHSSQAKEFDFTPWLAPTRTLVSRSVWGTWDKSRDEREEIESTYPSLDQLKSAARSGVRKHTFLDIEHLPLDIRKVPDDEVERNIDIISWIADRMREFEPSLRLGMYAFLPLTDYWSPQTTYHNGRPRNTQTQRDRMRQWRTANRRLGWSKDVSGLGVYEGLADHFDVCHPQLYAYYPYPEHWLEFAMAMILEARKYGKQVYPFIMPEFHPGGNQLRNTFIDSEMWKLILQTCLDHADGFVLWTGNKTKFSEDIEWWNVTRDFIETNNLSRRNQ